MNDSKKSDLAMAAVKQATAGAGATVESEEPGTGSEFMPKGHCTSRTEKLGRASPASAYRALRLHDAARDGGRPGGLHDRPARVHTVDLEDPEAHEGGPAPTLAEGSNNADRGRQFPATILAAVPNSPSRAKPADDRRDSKEDPGALTSARWRAEMPVSTATLRPGWSAWPFDIHQGTAR